MCATPRSARRRSALAASREIYSTPGDSAHYQAEKLLRDQVATLPNKAHQVSRKVTALQTSALDANDLNAMRFGYQELEQASCRRSAAYGSEIVTHAPMERAARQPQGSLSKSNTARV